MLEPHELAEAFGQNLADSLLGWAMRATFEREVAISVLKQALQQRQPPHNLLHQVVSRSAWTISTS
jgi:hypothetical protein